MALAVFPERMNPIDPEDVEVSLRTLERYIQYMTERVEFVLSRNYRTTTALGDAAQKIDGDVSELADDVGDIFAVLAGKVDKEADKGLSTEDYTTDDKTKLAGIEAGAEVNVIETVMQNGTALPVTDKAVDVTVPTAVSDLTNDSEYQTAAQVETAVSGKVDKVSGKGLSTNDYTNADKAKLDGIEWEYAKLSNPMLLLAGANLNTLVTPGTYMTENGTAGKTMLYTPGADPTTHLNTSIGSFVVDIRRWDTAGRLSQTLLTMRGAQYHRYTTSGTSASPTWTEWTQMS